MVEGVRIVTKEISLVLEMPIKEPVLYMMFLF